MMGKTVQNEGTIVATMGNVQMASGEKISLNLNGNSLVKLTIDEGTLNALVENKGLIQADGGQVYLTTQALNTILDGMVNNSGVIEAQSLNNIDGKIILFAHGGTANISGSITAEGGFVETSGEKVKINDDFRVKADKWLIDPNDFTISASGGDMSGTTLSTNLSSASVEIQTATMGTSGGNGDIFVNDAVTWSSGNTLTLNAERNIEINSVIDASGGDGGKLVLQYGQGAVATGNTAFYDVNAPVKLQSGQNFSTKLGSDGSTIDWTVITTLGAEGSTTGTDLQGINGALAGNYVLGANIDAASTSTWDSGAGFDPIGDNATKFTGKFDGLGNTISNLTIDRPTEDYVGLFGYAHEVTIKNIGLINVNVTGKHEVGGLIGRVDGDWAISKVSDAYVTGTVQGERKVGGLIGFFNNYGATITDVYAAVEVTSLTDESESSAGGLIGDNHGIVNRAHATGRVIANKWAAGGLIGDNGGTVTNVYATGEVTGADTSGGLIGFNKGTIDTAYATGKVTGTDNVGGLVGDNSSGNPSWDELNKITNSYATGVVEGTGENIGGLVGYHGKGTVTDSYATGNVIGHTNVGGLVGLNESSIASSYALGQVDLISAYAGGLVGYNYGTITNSYAMGNVIGAASAYGIGGLVGSNNGTYGGGIIDYTYAIGSVTGDEEIGGLAGNNTGGGSITNSFRNITANPDGDMDHFSGVGKTLAELLTPSTFIDAGWDTDIWSFPRVGLGAAVEGYEYGGGIGLPYLTNVTHADHRIGEVPTILFDGGWGDVDGNGAYTITNATQLQNINFVVSDGFDFELSNAIDLDGVTWTQIGTYTGNNPLTSFTGSFNGQNHTISNLTVGGANSTHVGLFGSIYNASLTNIHLDGVRASGMNSVGGLVGYGYGTTNTIKNILITNTARDSIIENSGTLSGISYIGGVGGSVNSVEMENIISHAHVEIYSVGKAVSNIGGLFGNLQVSAEATVGPKNLVNHGDVTVWNNGGNNLFNTGGLIGAFAGLSDLTLDTIEMTGDVIVGSSGNAAYEIGGLIGSVWGPGSNTIDNAIMRGDFKTHITIDEVQHKAFGLMESGGLFGILHSNTEIKNSHMYGNVDVQVSSSPTLDMWIVYGIGGILGTGAADGIVLNNVHTHGDVSVVMGAGDPVEMDGFAVGGLLGINWSEMTITDSSMKGNISGYNSVGGLAGKLWNKLTVTDSHFLGETISGHDYVGGLVGNIHDFYGPDGDQLIITGSSSSGVISGNNYVGGLIGKLPTDNHWAPHEISQSHSTATVTATGNYAGGLVGYMDKTAIDNAYFAGSVSGANNVGGLVGYMNKSSVTESYATGAVEGANNVGGLVGMQYSSQILNTYAIGEVTGASNVGGLVGYFYDEGSHDKYIMNSYATGAVTGTSNVGGLVGSVLYLTDHLRNNFWNTETSGLSGPNDGVGHIGYDYSTESGVIGKTTKELQTLATFDENGAGWNIELDTTQSKIYPYLTFDEDGGAIWKIGKYSTALNYTLGTANTTYNGLDQLLSSFWTNSIFGDAGSSLVYEDDYKFIYNTADATSFKNAGTYNGISVVLLNADYELEGTPSTGTLAIAKAAATVTANSDLTKVYNGLSQSVTGFSATGLVNDETIAVLDGVSGATASGTNAGTYTTALTGSDENYNLTFENGTLMILPKVNDLITTIVNQTAVAPVLQPISSPINAQSVSTSTPMQIVMGSTPGTFTLVSTTDGSQTVEIMTTEQLQQMNPGMNEIRVALGQDSFVELINGGVLLPKDLGQEYDVVNNNTKKSKKN
jgi:hypothetical protein